MKKKKQDRKNKIYMYAAVSVAIAIIAVSAVTQTLKPRPPKANAQDYFAVTDAIPTSWDDEGSTEEYLLVLAAAFNFTAIGGDAHHVVITPFGQVDQAEIPYFTELKQNVMQSVTLPTSDIGVPSHKTANGYEYRINVDSDEAKGLITFYFTE